MNQTTQYKPVTITHSHTMLWGDRCTGDVKLSINNAVSGCKTVEVALTASESERIAEVIKEAKERAIKETIAACEELKMQEHLNRVLPIAVAAEMAQIETKTDNVAFEDIDF